MAEGIWRETVLGITSQGWRHARQLRSLTVLVEKRSSAPSTHVVVAHNQPQLQFQVVQYPLLVLLGT